MQFCPPDCIDRSYDCDKTCVRYIIHYLKKQQANKKRRVDTEYQQARDYTVNRVKR